MPHAFYRILAVCVLVIRLSLPTVPAAQGLGSLLPGASTSASDDSALSDALDNAARNGVSVIVIDSDGRVISRPDASAPSSTDPGSGTNLMAIQDDAVAFRSALVDRLLNLPIAFNEVIYILRATSPDGTIFAYVQALLISLALFAAGMVFESQVFGKRLVKRFVVARIHAAPSGYVEKKPFLVFRFFMGVVGTLVSMAVA